MRVIHDEVQQLLVAEHLFWETQRLIRRNKRLHKPSAYYRYMGDAHIALVLSGIRRQIKIDHDSISFARLLTEIADNPQTISRKGYCDLYTDSVVAGLADKHFDRMAGVGNAHYPRARALADLRKLRKRLAECEAFADRRIAHRDRRPPKLVPKLVDATRSIRLLDRLWCKYNLLLTANHCDTLMPTFQYDWAEVFDSPWRRRRAI